MKPSIPAKRSRQAEQAVSDLAGVIGHELNNIAVPLQGFADLALQDARASEGDLAMLDEIRIAIARIRSLAADLESLGTTGSDPSAVPMRDCMPEVNAEGSSMPAVDWQCDPSTVIVVDSVHAHRALRALAAVSSSTGTAFSAPAEWSIALSRPSATRCAACDAPLPRKTQVLVRAFTARALPPETLREPFGAARVGRASRRLGLAVLTHSTHCAGGHIFVDENAVALCLVFPPG
jgi:hypothetical protein